jgi:hypothetical protein
MREVTNLAWPQAAYSTKHRPIQQEIRLLTGLAIGAEGWAAVHLPVHRTRTLTLTGARLGIHAVHQPDEGPARSPMPPDVAGWLVLDRLLLAARRQATAIAGDDSREDLARVVRLIAAGGLGSAPGLSTLLPEWPSVGSVPARATASRAQLIELQGQALPPGAAVLAQYPTPHLGWGTGEEYLIAMIAAATAVALAAAELTGRYSLTGRFAVPDLLDSAAGDLLPFADLEPCAIPAVRQTSLGSAVRAATVWAGE